MGLCKVALFSNFLSLQILQAKLMVQVMHNMPFLRGVPKPVFEMLLARGQLIKCTKGELIWTPPRPAAATARGGSKAEGGEPCAPSGLYIVMAGLVRSSYVNADGHTQVCCLPCCQLLFPDVIHFCLGPQLTDHNAFCSGEAGLHKGVQY